MVRLEKHEVGGTVPHNWTPQAHCRQFEKNAVQTASAGKTALSRHSGGRNDNRRPLGHKKGVVGWIFGKLEEFAKVFHRFCRYIE